MSDLYDSLEDESDDDSCHSLDNLKATFPNSGDGIVERCGSISDPEPFFLEQKEKSEERIIEVQRVQATTTATSTTITDLVSKKCCQPKSFLPRVVDEVKAYGSNSVSFNLAIDNEDLVKKGLQLNKDGSFTKSPRFETEQLPFVNPEYKNIQLQKIKTPLRGGKSRFSKKNRKNIFTFKENSKDEISMTGIIKSRDAKGSSEEILTSDGSLMSFKEIPTKSGENFDSDNLTDSMKEMIMQKQKEGITARANKSSELYKTPVRGASLSRTSKCFKSKMCSSKSDPKESLPNVCGDKQNNNFEKRKSQPNTWKKFLPQVGEGTAKTSNPVSKSSEIFLNFSKPRLSYFERRQKENGFNPLYLRYGVKRVPSDTNRSNFGDSVAENLSEMSARVVSSRGFTDDEDEESFYRKLIEKDKSKQWEAKRTSRSDIQKENEKSVQLCSSNSCKNQKELTRGGKFYSRQKLKKSTSIDMPAATGNAPMNPTKKYSHYCSVNMSTSSLSKTELALKARAYGYMANARNIFKMKTHSEGKVLPSESELTGKRICKKVINNESSTRPNESSEEIERVTSKRLLRTSKSLCKAEKYDSVADKEIVFPPVSCPETKDLEYKAEVLKRIRCCLSGGTDQNFRDVELTNVFGDRTDPRGKYVDSFPPFKCAR